MTGLARDDECSPNENSQTTALHNQRAPFKVHDVVQVVVVP
jgi:hypothetical protein